MVMAKKRGLPLEGFSRASSVGLSVVILVLMRAAACIFLRLKAGVVVAEVVNGSTALARVWKQQSRLAGGRYVAAAAAARRIIHILYGHKSSNHLL